MLDVNVHAFTIGHSNHAAELFVRLLLEHRIEGVVDVRSSPHSRFNPQFNRKKLEATLEQAGMGYGFMGGALGGRPADPSCYDGEGRVQYDRLAETDAFKAGIRDLVHLAGDRRIALMCSEKEPLHCHRTLLVAQVLTAGGLGVSHILANGSLQDHSAAMDRLLDRFNLPRQGDMFCSRERHIANAVGRQAQQVAYAGRPPGTPRRQHP